LAPEKVRRAERSDSRDQWLCCGSRRCTASQRILRRIRNCPHPTNGGSYPPVSVAGSCWLVLSLYPRNRWITFSGMSQPTSNDPLHGVTLERLLTALVERHGWEELGRMVPIRCFLFDPSIKSSLTFLRKTPWARAKVEQLYIEAMRRSPPS